MKRVNVEVRGIQPLLMHSPQGVDPTHPLVREKKALTSKPPKKKTDADHETVDWLDYQLAIYFNGKHVYVPDTAIMGTLRAGAAEASNGKNVLAGVDIAELEVPLIYEGPQTVRELYDQRFVDRRPAGVQKARVMRVRPRFNVWALRFSLVVDEAVIALDKVRTSLEVAGLRKGLLDHRPRFGRFEVTSWKEAK